MNKKDWKRQVVAKCQEIGTYKDEFLPVINTLADILEERDRIRKQYHDEGDHPLVIKVSDRGATNNVKNPLLAAWEDLNRDALVYWRELGLTPAGFKKLNTETAKVKVSGGSLEQLLAGLGNGEES